MSEWFGKILTENPGLNWTSPEPQVTLHRCPVCEGSGKLLKPYTMIDGICYYTIGYTSGVNLNDGTSDTLTCKCRACQGKGYIER